MIWLSSDLHLSHDRAFIYEPRGFVSVEDMNTAIVERFNSVVEPEDELFILGDLMLGEYDEKNLSLIQSLNGKKTIIAGNHDTPRRRGLYETVLGIAPLDALYKKMNGYHCYLSHYPTITSNLEKESLKQCTINFFGHTHQQDNFYKDIPYLYHVGVDSHDCYPVSIDQAIEDIKAKIKECKEYL